MHCSVILHELVRQSSHKCSTQNNELYPDLGRRNLNGTVLVTKAVNSIVHSIQKYERNNLVIIVS